MNKGKKGAVLILALLVMFVGGIILGGLFMYLDTSLLLATRGEENAVNYYAADSGVEDAIAWLQHKPWEKPVQPLAGWDACDPLSDDPLSQPCGNSYEINGRNVNVSVVNPTGFGNNTFKITSNATTEKGTRITIESYVDALTLSLSAFGDYAISSNCSVTLQPGVPDGEILGDVIYVDDPDCGIICHPTTDPLCQKVNMTGNITSAPKPPGLDWWPDVEDLLNVFGLLAKDAEYLTFDEKEKPELDVSIHPTIGPLYREGDLDIMSSDEGASASLDGIIYVTGDLTIGGAKSFTLNLSDQIIFAVGAIDVGGKTTLTGSGSIIALGDIYFAPNMQSEESDFVFIISVLGEVQLQPSGDFWGSVAGAEHVQVQPGNIVGHRDPGDVGFEFPGIEPIFDILIYDIIDR